MKKTYLCGVVLMLLVAGVFGAEDAKAKGDDSLKKRMAAKGQKDFNIKTLEGKWFEVASSKEIHQMFVKGCSCSTIEFKPIAENKLHVLASCRNETSGQINSINGTLTQVNAKESPALFHLAFTEKNASIPVAVSGQKADTASAPKADAAAQKAEAKPAEKPEAKGAEQANAVVLRSDKDTVLMGSPVLDALWILNRSVKLEDKEFDELKKFAEENGFNTNFKKASHEKCDQPAQPAQPPAKA